MNIGIAGTGYVGLVTGVCLAEVGHHVTCLDVSQEKIDMLKGGHSPIFEPGLDDMLQKNIREERLHFTTDRSEAYENKELIFIAVGTPEGENGKADLSYVKTAAREIAASITNDVVIVTKSTVPVGTNEMVEDTVKAHGSAYQVHAVSNPEFLREGNAIHDAFHGDRIVIGGNHQPAVEKVAELYAPFDIPIVRTDTKSAELIKYASNAFLATKISFINEIANICEITGANVEAVAQGMGLDKRIGTQFLKAGIGFGGSCFPKDTKALTSMSAEAGYEFRMLNAVLEVNELQHNKLMEKANEYSAIEKGTKAAVLGLAFKPNTDDTRDTPAIRIIEELQRQGADIVAYDPIATDKMKEVFPDLTYTNSLEEAVNGAETAFIITDWAQIKEQTPAFFTKHMKRPLIFDGRNCFDPGEMVSGGVHYHSIGRSGNSFRMTMST
ncbi:UDP-glucose/GDP-mannose dehydrogenase family protein [Jeotgalibacillus salarius]|uniref:UDP-glucose 6-dehydrogenase n=2 Tax=Jeotgalibacillus salarius TaxID=546023 RepID=A0A4Y8LP99_9BACL|nr:UDP-glucose/GDP-mannose dehydrogenase family protein [Jeotgalibacillus salarius]TFE04227.1 UDP-glucose/GDP-mannose dehydrogenase family protein [Jeotgalibacillus salarius]